MDKQEQHNDFEALCAGYVLGALSNSEAAEFEDALKQATPEQLQFFEEMKSVRDEMALASGFEAPSPKVEEAIFSTISGVNTDKKGRDAVSNIIPLWVYKAVAALLLIGALTLAYFNFGLNEIVTEQQAQITQLQSDLERQDQLLNVLAAREITLVMMGGLDPSPEGFGKIIWDTDNRRAVLQLANLPAPPDEKDYQLWLIKDGQNPISAGVFSFDQPSSDLFFKVEQIAEDPSPISNAFAVTLEPKGGMPQPTGDLFLLGAQE
ncbi:MAG: anti-sigma factor [Balneolaceae bacterium]|nr:MAG: anti-sigma factor [Balneolaceae bacterium]